MSPRKIVDPRGKILKAIRDSMRDRGFPPTVQEIADTVGLSSKSSVAHHLRALAQDGLIERVPNRPRALVVHEPPPRHLHALADQIHPTEGTTPAATGAAVIRHMKEPCAMPEPTETFRRAREVKAGEVIVRHPHNPEQTGEWTATADAHPYGFNASIFCRDEQGREGAFNLGPCDFVIVRGADLLTNEERQQAYEHLSADDCGHVAAHLLKHFPRVLDDCLRALGQYEHGLPEGA